MYRIFHIGGGWRCVLIALAVMILIALAVPAGSRPASAEASPRVLIVMYHSLLKDPKAQGKYVISPELFENDLRYLSDNGYHTVTVADLLEYVDKGTPLPEKPVMLTFDDGYYNNYYYALPLLEKYDARMVLSPIGRYTDEYAQSGDRHVSYAHCDWETLRKMVQTGRVELQNHSYNMHSLTGRRGIAIKTKETLADYRSALTEDVMTMQRKLTENVGMTPTAFTYPFGAVSRETLPLLRELGFQATLGCEEGINTVTRDPECLYDLKRILRTGSPDSAAFFRQWKIS